MNEYFTLLATYCTPWDWCELLASIGITYYLTTQVYKKYGTTTYVTVVSLAGLFLLALLTEHALTATLLVLFAAGLYGTQAPTYATAQRMHSEHVPVSPSSKAWIDPIIAISIEAFHNGISCTWIIETDHSLLSVLRTDVPLNAPLSPKLGPLLGKIMNAHTPNILWVNNAGYIVGLNPTAPTSLIELSTTHNILLITTHAASKTYTMWHKNTVREHIASHHMYQIMKHIFSAQHNVLKEELCS